MKTTPWKTAGHINSAPLQLVLVAKAGLQHEQLPAESLLLQLTVALQKTLDVNTLIECFAREVRGVIPHDSIYFVNEDHGVYFLHGEAARHSCHYHLTVEGQSYGDLSFGRGRKFTEEELSLLEHLLCALVYPLRNALTYKAVVEEARRDPLTGVYNRGVMETVLAREVGLAHRHRSPFSAIFLDIDLFKSINDCHGHAVGDEAIRAFVRCVEKSIRTTDILSRYGGDEFLVLLNNTPLDGAVLLAERIRKVVEEEGRLGHTAPDLRLSASIGVATLQPGESAESLVARADAALNLAKQRGRNCVRADCSIASNPRLTESLH
ncbi:MAG: hypothetical protein A2151_02820 [Candidatus Muproteobacteria bacterium RBG_16_65_34]|uniref:diguanylate cyclase n=1 Tax=Candidatus Muproteobacteria bacterium RBG_16_65_34 TaxID=1817760 RepID=A0A1F6TSJ4_9PROT|nr:MAG: hypothetical protein A2151_02820 [Candidatus Muproteobacteria bacterium RBG_16_65_34]